MEYFIKERVCFICRESLSRTSRICHCNTGAAADECVRGSKWNAREKTREEHGNEIKVCFTYFDVSRAYRHFECIQIHHVV